MEFFDDEKGKANIILENKTKITKQVIDEFGNDFEKTQKGFIDFLLLGDKGFPNQGYKYTHFVVI